MAQDWFEIALHEALAKGLSLKDAYREAFELVADLFGFEVAVEVSL